MKIAIVTVGSRGDVQPTVALGCALKQAGHSVLIASDRAFKSFIESYGLNFHPIAGCMRTIYDRIEANPDKWMKIIDEDLRQLAGDFMRDCREISDDADLFMPQGLSYLFCGQVAAQRLSS